MVSTCMLTIMVIYLQSRYLYQLTTFIFLTTTLDYRSFLTYFIKTSIYKAVIKRSNG